MIMKELTTPDLADWTKFLEEIKTIDTNKLHEKAEVARKKKELDNIQGARIARLENLQTDAVEVLHLQLQHANLGNTQPSAAANVSPSYNAASPHIQYVPRGALPNTRPLAQQH